MNAPKAEQRGIGFVLGEPVAGDTTGVQPEFGRWQDVQRLFGIKRGTLYNLVSDGSVKSVSMRRKGNMHGCRLFYLPSVRAYLNALLEAQTAETNQQENKLDFGGAPRPEHQSE